MIVTIRVTIGTRSVPVRRSLTDARLHSRLHRGYGLPDTSPQCAFGAQTERLQSLPRRGRPGIDVLHAAIDAPSGKSFSAG
ncbi:hypothetical protein [Nocardioides sp.]|uniref:hypothetical protein n=1 Tax=Nocardioides sp. TaxID=35761 RepID=UPI0035289966